MNENMVVISKNEYTEILTLAYKAVMLKEAMLNAATDFYGNDLYFGSQAEVATIFKYAFPTDYESKLRELMDKKKAKEDADNER